MPYIYKIENMINHKVYIGQTVKSLSARKADHYCLLRHNKHHSTKLQKDWNEYGEEAFNFQKVLECSEEELNTQEAYYIQLFDSYQNGYNCNLGGHFRVDYHGVNNPMYGKRGADSPRFKDYILQIDKNTYEIIAEFEDVRTAATQVNGDYSTISKCLNHKRNNHKGFIWLYKQEYLNSPHFGSLEPTPKKDSR